MGVEIATSFAVFCYEGTILLGAGALTGLLLAKLFGGRLPESYRLPLGFGFFPVLVTWGGFIGIWRIPFVTEAAGLACAVAGVRWSVQAVRGATWAEIRASGRWYALPVFVVTLLFWMKSSYLLAGHSHGDEGRSVAFVTTFANNALKPGFLFDTSLPVAYPFYLFQAAAFGYRAVSGYLYPTIPLLAATLIAIFLSFRMLHLASQALFGSDGNRIFLLASAILVFSGLESYRKILIENGMSYLLVGPVQPYTDNLHAGYHYIWGVSIAVLGIAQLWTFLRTRNGDQWRLFVLCICLSFGYSGIPTLWIIVGACILLLAFIAESGKPAFLVLLRALPVSLLIWSGILIPQIFNFLPRIVQQFSFSLPHPWYPRDIEVFIEQTGHSFELLKSFAVGPIGIIRGAGILIFASLPLSILVCMRQIRKRSISSASPVFPLCVIVSAAVLILTCTTSITSDWFARGFIGTEIVGSLVMAYLLLPYVSSRKYLPQVLVLGIPLALLHSIAFLRSYEAPNIPMNFSEIREWNRKYPFETVFYTKEFGEKADQLMMAGRYVITVPSPPLYAYFLHPDTYRKMGLEPTFVPCEKSWYGNNSPPDTFVYVDDPQLKMIPCSSVIRKKVP